MGLRSVTTLIAPCLSSGVKLYTQSVGTVGCDHIIVHLLYTESGGTVGCDHIIVHLLYTESGGTVDCDHIIVH